MSTADDLPVAVPVDALARWLRAFAALAGEHREELTALDAAIGDADHGTNLDRGMRAVAAALEESPPPGAAALLKLAGMTLVRTVGGASGALYGTFFLRMAGALDDTGPVPPDALARALRAGLDGLAARGRAEPGDKTMVDALTPAVQVFERELSQGRDLAAALSAASGAADAGRDSTVAMQARKGRASYLGERSTGHQDPGATSAALLIAAAARTLGSP